MKVLILGSGGREHAIAATCANNPDTDVFIAPGNAGTALDSRLTNVPLAIDDFDALADFCREQAIDLTLVGPEQPLAAGIVDCFLAQGLCIFGPSQACARLESSKAFSKHFMQQNRIPTAEYSEFTTPALAKAYVEERATPIVIKADGLAAGKGVVIAHTHEEAYAAIDDMLIENKFGHAGAKVVIEQFLTGDEVSFIAICDGKTCLPFASSQDHKARDEGDKGPNTGGMGAYSPAPRLTPQLEQQVIRQVMQPVIEAMADNGTPYVGFLYAGLMISPSNKFHVLEFNCRLGDPETQILLLRLQSDLTEVCYQATQGALDPTKPLRFSEDVSLGVVLCAKGYPFDYPKGEAITGLDSRFAGNITVFHAGTRLDGEHVVTNGGRVLMVCATAATLATAQADAYQACQQISWAHQYYRHDIGHRAL